MNLQTTTRDGQAGRQFFSRFGRNLRGLLMPIAVASALPLVACTSVSPEITQNSAAYPDVITYQIAAIKSSLHRDLFMAPPPGSKPTGQVNTDNLILSGATPDSLAAAGVRETGRGLHDPSPSA